MGCSSWILRLSTFRPRASRIASAISVVVTDPYRRPSGPAWAGMVRTVLVRVSAWSLARSAAWAAARSAASWARRGASIAAGGAGGGGPGGGPDGGGGRGGGEPAGDQVLAQEALGAVDARAALAEVVDVFEQEGVRHA